ncbi:HpcH/HpaI aldolase/citrate lyase family protein [Nocardioides sp. SYSU DS0663]|uniref:HpcH/HpaI aldolase/citrate lyase family protein n=1 Tax=Nocardioides sp. SYSU DS0663 TaxID=3416445 RepID=UPI003F4B8C72
MSAPTRTPARTPAILPRSFLYTPATRADLFAKAAAGPADAVVLDLEDAVPLPDKETARAAVRDWLAAGHPSAAEQWVRIDAAAIGADLDAAVHPGLSGVFLAKTSVPALEALGAELDRLEPERGVAAGAVAVVGLVEDARALLDLAALARSPRLTTFGIGEVDLLADLRMARSERTTEAVTALRSQVVAHCAAAGLAAPVAPTSTDFRDLAGFAETTRLLQDLGFRSRTAIHPAQVAVINDVLTPAEEAVAAARDVVERFEATGGGVTTDERGRLIDAAVVRGAQETLARADRSREG